MKFHSFAFFLAGVAAAILRAGPTETAIVSAMNLSTARNYGWVADVVDDAGAYTIDGKTDLTEDKDWSLVTMPMKTAARRTTGRGSSSSGATTTVIFKGDEQFVVETPDGWKKSGDVANSDSREGRGRGGYGRSGGVGGRGSLRGRGGRGNDTSGASSSAYSNLQETLNRPHEEIALIVAGYTELKPETDGVSGTLSEMNAKLLLVHAGQKDLNPLRGSGTFRLWVKDGALVKYQVKLEGTLAVEGTSGHREVQVHQTTTTTIRDVGTTKFTLPEAARKQLGG